MIKNLRILNEMLETLIKMRSEYGRFSNQGLRIDDIITRVKIAITAIENTSRNLADDEGITTRQMQEFINTGDYSYIQGRKVR